MSSFFDRQRDDYVNLLLRVSTREASEDGIGFFLRGVSECAWEGQKLTDDLLAPRDRYHAAVRAARSSVLLGTLIDDLFRVPTITIGRTTKLLSVTPATASSNLRKLKSLGILEEVSGRTRGQVFVAREILGFVGRDIGASGPAAS